MNYLKSILLIIIVSLFGSLFQHTIALTNLAMLYILVVVITAIRWGRRPALAAAVLSVLVFDFFFVPPRYSLTVAHAQYLITFATLFTVGLVISSLALKAKERAEAASQARLLKEAEKLQTAFLNSVSHDLRTPLAAISGSLSSLLQDPGIAEAERNSLLETAAEEAEKLNQLVGDLLDMARVEAGALKVFRKPVDVEDLIGTALGRMEKALHGFQVSTALPYGLPEVDIDFPLMLRVMANIIDNAVKYSSEDKQIEIAARREGQFVGIEISDRGIGIPPTDLEQVFRKFHRVRRPPGWEGTGLGLSVCKGIIEAHGGTIRAENRAGGGTVIKLKLSVFSGDPHAQG
ncbi:MAG: hypothetical protein A2Y69_10500 [Candidatus Aminicenantes bacterium RBG_13_59_9]|nr:MAG: hypothetical protein A2Y69_10500 [Candidatus Aminicenantes bacterium RBG_13_59_9]